MRTIRVPGGLFCRDRVFDFDEVKILPEDIGLCSAACLPPPIRFKTKSGEILRGYTENFSYFAQPIHNSKRFSKKGKV